jgi:hypothetical protein
MVINDIGVNLIPIIIIVSSPNILPILPAVVTGVLVQGSALWKICRGFEAKAG